MSKKLALYNAARINFSIFMTFLYIPFGYWTSPGSESAIIYMVFMTIFILSFIAVNKWEILFPVLVIIEALFFLQTEIWFPDHYYIYEDAKYRIIDLSLNFIVIALAILLTIYYVTSKSAKHSEELYQESITDSLTGLYNQRFLSDFIQTEYSRAVQTGNHFTIVLMDLNNFKKINDDYGHLEGDKVLKDIAAIITDNIRSYDIASRYGGDEFCITLPNTTKEQAQIYIEKLTESFETYSKNYKSVRLSVALGEEDSKDKSLNDIYKSADELMYQKKRQQKEGPQQH